MTAHPDRAVEDAVEAVLAGYPNGRILLAVSGGRDSMVLLHAASRVAPRALLGVATFDHGTGTHARATVSLVRAAAGMLGLPVVAGVGAPNARDPADATEATWREARWRFLRSAATQGGAHAIATAHTADDQVETVALRLLRGAGARGLVGLAAPSAGIIRPLLGVSRAKVASYAAAHQIRYADDPANRDLRHARVRLRHDLLPAIERVRPGAGDALRPVAARSATWRGAVDRWAAAHARQGDPPDDQESDTQEPDTREPDTREPDDQDSERARAVACIGVNRLAQYDAETLAIFWPAFAARAGVRLDRRALARLVAFTPAAARRVRDGTVQPASIPVASEPPGARVELRHVPFIRRGPIRPEFSAQGWEFVVRGPGGCEGGPPMDVADPGRPDYA